MKIQEIVKIRIVANSHKQFKKEVEEAQSLMKGVQLSDVIVVTTERTSKWTTFLRPGSSIRVWNKHLYIPIYPLYDYMQKPRELEYKYPYKKVKEITLIYIKD